MNVPNPFDPEAYQGYIHPPKMDLNVNITARKSRHPNSVAAERENRSRRGEQASRVLGFLAENGPHTCDEISDALEMNYTTVSAILSLLKGIGGHVRPAQVRETGERRPTRRSNGKSSAAVVEIIRYVTAEELFS